MSLRETLGDEVVDYSIAYEANTALNVTECGNIQIVDFVHFVRVLLLVPL